MRAGGGGRMHKGIRLVLSIAVACVVWGCTAIELKKEADEQQRRVDQKEQELRSAQSEQARLESEKQKLLKDLDDKRMTTDELQSKLARLRKENANAVAATEEQRRKKKALHERIQQYEAQLESVKRNKTMAADERTKYVEHLKKEIKKQLEVSLY
jgi:chromosome segregation ATPase